MDKPKRLHLFQAYGIELEYMIVDRDTLNIAPIADKLLAKAAGKQTDEFVNGSVTWSNELVLHVIELKCSIPTPDLVQLNLDFAANIALANSLLEEFNARMMPTAAHPWMDPARETLLWPHGNSEIYETYNRIFNCQGHGWANLQSTHINLPFYDDEEFAALHAAIRVILPILPALAASSPILGEKASGFLDTRMTYYQTNQKRIPSITGKVIPEKAFSKRTYHKLIYDKITEDIKPFDHDKVLEAVWLNSRGCIARFDRGSVEIRVLDIQECPKADLAVAQLIIHVLKLLTREKLSSIGVQQDWSVSPLFDIMTKTIKDGGRAVISDPNYLRTLGMTASSASVTEVWKHLLLRANEHYAKEMEPWVETIERILHKGNLSTRILQVAQNVYTKNNLKLIYQELAENLEENKQFEKCDHIIL